MAKIMSTQPLSTATLLLSCPDRRGLVAKLSQFLYEHGANILHTDQHEDRDAGIFIMRIEWDICEFDLNAEQFKIQFQPLATDLDIEWTVKYSKDLPRVAIFVSKFDHCLADLLYRNRIGELKCEIALVVSNHPDTRELAQFYKIPFHEIKEEPKQIALMQELKIDLIILARYMQILSARFVQTFENRIINIHHSFLPAFSGAKPYHQAFTRGVKIIGASSHYVTEKLDEGPIIEQGVARISQRDQVGDLIQKGRDLERMVLSRAVQWHLESRIMIYSHKTVVFD
jgi:formyltetrahydrofolate deformylase